MGWGLAQPAGTTQVRAGGDGAVRYQVHGHWERTPRAWEVRGRVPRCPGSRDSSECHPMSQPLSPVGN